MIVISGVMKLSGARQIVENMSRIGLGPYLPLFGIIELVSVALLFIPKTRKLGFLLLCCYLGGALSVELAGGQPPMAALFLVFLWIGIYLQDKFMFLGSKRIEQA